jgi:hypothetical protein
VLLVCCMHEEYTKKKDIVLSIKYTSQLERQTCIVGGYGIANI